MALSGQSKYKQSSLLLSQVVFALAYQRYEIFSQPQSWAADDEGVYFGWCEIRSGLQQRRCKTNCLEAKTSSQAKPIHNNIYFTGWIKPVETISKQYSKYLLTVIDSQCSTHYQQASVQIFLIFPSLWWPAWYALSCQFSSIYIDEVRLNIINTFMTTGFTAGMFY